jgi:outer membrane protein
MMNTQIRVLLSLCLFAMSLAQAAELRIGVVNIERVLRESEPALKSGKMIEKEFSARDQEIKAIIKQAKDLQQSLEKDGGKSDVEHSNKERDLANLNANLQRLQREFREEMNLRKNEELAQVLESANKAIQAISENEKYDLVIQEAVYHNPKIDITEKVLQYLANEKSDLSDKSKK